MRNIWKYVCAFLICTVFIMLYIYGYTKKESNPKISESAIKGSDKPADYMEDVIKKDATMVLETKTDSQTVTTMEKIPVEIIGYTREQVVDFIEENSERFIKDKEELVDINLLSFSSDKLVIRKTVKEKKVMVYNENNSERFNYYVSLDDNKVIVYKRDKQTVFIDTGISLDMIDKSLREQIEKGLWIENIGQLYRFLESITS